MKSITLTRFDPHPSEGDAVRWDVGYDAVLDDGREVNSVTTVYRQQAPTGERAEILAIADAAILPGLILQDRQQAPGLPTIPEPSEPPAADNPGADVALPDAATVPPPERGHRHGSKKS